MGILKPPRRCEKILRNFDLLLPKFHFILPKFHSPVPWGIFVCSLDIPDFLGRRVTVVGTNGSCLAGWRPLCQIGTCNGCRDARSCVRCIKGYSIRCVKCYSVVVLTGTDARPCVPTAVIRWCVPTAGSSYRASRDSLLHAETVAKVNSLTL